MALSVVIGIDSSTTATKAIAWTADGSIAAEGRRAIPMRDLGDGRYEQDPRDWWSALCGSLRDVAALVPASSIAGIAIANQRETMVPCDARMQPLRPAMVWMDERGRSEVATLTEAVGAARMHHLSGKPADLTPAVYRLAWMRRHEPALHQRIAWVMEVHAWLVHRLTGEVATSWACADPLGLFDMQARAYAPEILQAIGLSAGQFPEAYKPGTLLGRLTEDAAAATGLPAGLAVIAGAGDGQAAGLGVDILQPGRAYLNLGTAVVAGQHAAEYAIDTAFRTMISPTGDGYIQEYALRSGTFLIDWLVRQMLGLDPLTDPGIYDRLEQAAAGVAPGADGLLLLPYWLGVMPPYWDGNARGALVGLSPRHDPAHLYRAVLEGIAFDVAQATGSAVTEFVAIGGGARSDLWCQIFADILAVPVRRSATVECTSLGAAIAAAVGVGWFPDFARAATAMRGAVVRSFLPEPEAMARYARILPLYRDLYPSLRRLFEAQALEAATS